jgi:putative inorganic carbon (hco3(-)) transporter
VTLGAFGFIGALSGFLAGYDPTLAIIAGVGVAFALIVLANLYAGLILFTLVTFVAQIPGVVGSDVTLSKIVGLLLAMSWAAVLLTRQDARAELPRVHPVFTIGIVLFLSWVAFSQLWAEDSALVLDAFFRLTLNAALIFIVFTAVRTPGQAIGVIAAFVAGATISAVYGLVFVSPEAGDEAARLSTGLENPNELATILVAALALALGLAGALRSNPLARIAALMAAALCLAGVFLTGSRGGLVALAVALFAFLLIGRRFRGRTLLLIVAAVLAAVGYYTNIASPEARERIAEAESGTGRTDLWVIGWRMVEAEPLHGVGAGNFTEVAPGYLLQPGTIERSDFVIGPSPKGAHNMYLHLWSELGTVGFVLLLFVLGFGVYAAAQAARTFARCGNERMETVSRALFVALLAILAADFFGSRQYQKELWFLLGLAPALWEIARAEAARREA